MQVSFAFLEEGLVGSISERAAWANGQRFFWRE